jgi:hypothetical protein
VDAHLVFNKIRLGEQYVELTGHEEHASLRSVSVKITGDTRFNSGGLRRLQRGEGGGEAGGGGARCSLASRALNAASSLLSILLVAWVASAWSLSHFSMFWSHLASITNGGGVGGNRW